MIEYCMCCGKELHPSEVDTCDECDSSIELFANQVAGEEPPKELPF